MDITTPKRPLSFFGQIVATRHAVDAVDALKISKALQRHFAFDWSDCPPGDRQANQDALSDGSRIFGSYKVGGGIVLWVITEAENDSGVRESTTVLLPEDY